MLIDIRHESYKASTDVFLRQMHAAAIVTRSKIVIEALERAAQEYYHLAYIEAPCEPVPVEYVANTLLAELAA